MEIETSEFSLNGEIVEKYPSFLGGENRSSKPGSAYLSNDEIILIKRGNFSKKIHEEIYIKYKDIISLKLRQKQILRPGAIKIYTESKKFYIEKKKAEKLEPFFEELKERINRSKSD